MVNVPSRVKKALFEKGWTQKKLCGEIDISENGFKRMAENNTWKLETIEKIANALDLPVTYFVLDSEQSSVETKYSTEDNYLRETLEKLQADFAKLSTVLMTKEQQIDKLLDLLGKPEGVTVELLSAAQSEFNVLLNSYRASTGHGELFKPKPTNKRRSKVGGTQFSQDENALITS